jgi:hypothetical protein
MTEQQFKVPIPVKIIATFLFLFGLFAFFGSLFLWGEGFLLQFPAGVDYRFPVTDILVNAPAAMTAAIGLWRMKRYGYVAAQFVAGFYIYGSVEIFVDVVQGGLPTSIEIVAPQVMAVILAVVLVLYLWQIQERFELKQSKTKFANDTQL